VLVIPDQSFILSGKVNMGLTWPNNGQRRNGSPVFTYTTGRGLSGRILPG
jgi:hypothetical protein